MTEEAPEWTQLTVPENSERMRADKFLATQFSDLSRSQLEKAFKGNNVRIGDTTITKKHIVEAKDIVELVIPSLKPTSLEPYEMELDVLFEDDDVIAINKAPGIIIHPGSGTGPDTLVHALLQHCKGKLSRAGGELRPGVVHRLDKETSGIIIFAKTDAAYYKLIEAFSERIAKKEYLALVDTSPELLGGSIKEPITRHPVSRTKMAVDERGKPAHTDWKREATYGKDFALIRCFLHTGRTHQIRVHLSHLGHPIIGDASYGYKKRKNSPVNAPRVLLHATKLSLPHPTKDTMINLEVPVPKDFQDVLDTLDQAVKSSEASPKRRLWKEW